MKVNNKEKQNYKGKNEKIITYIAILAILILASSTGAVASKSLQKQTCTLYQSNFRTYREKSSFLSVTQLEPIPPFPTAGYMKIIQVKIEKNGNISIISQSSPSSEPIPPRSIVAGELHFDVNISSLSSVILSAYIQKYTDEGKDYLTVGRNTPILANCSAIVYLNISELVKEGVYEFQIILFSSAGLSLPLRGSEGWWLDEKLAKEGILYFKAWVLLLMGYSPSVSNISKSFNAYLYGEIEINNEIVSKVEKSDTLEVKTKVKHSKISRGTNKLLPIYLIKSIDWFNSF